MNLRRSPAYCPYCSEALSTTVIEEQERLHCPQESCEHVHWDNPVPVVAGIIELNNKIVLAQNANWSTGTFRLITGYVEAHELAEDAMLRELKEELGLKGEIASFVGHYHFEKKNEMIIAFHVKAKGQIDLGHEIADYKMFDLNELEPWPSCTGEALKDWLVGQKN